MAFNISQGLVKIQASLDSINAPVVKEYSIQYVAGLDEAFTQYNIRYQITGLSESSDSYRIAYSSHYGDVTATYSVRYHSGREVSEYISRYSVKYTSAYTDDVSTLYSLKFTTTSPNSLSYRTIYRMRYESAGSDEVVTSYRVRYTNEYFKDRTQEYSIRFSSETPFMFDTNAVLLRNEDKTSVLFFLQGRSDLLEDMLLVFSNLPKYQLVEFSVDVIRPHVHFLDIDQVSQYNLFGEDFLNTSDRLYMPCAYILVEGVEELNALSLDVYEKITLEKRNINKSFFFNLDSTEFYSNPVVLGEETYQVVNYSSNYYNYRYLNFIEKSLTPIFKVFDNCCFNIKITDKTSGGACSPF